MASELSPSCLRHLHPCVQWGTECAENSCLRAVSPVSADERGHSPCRDTAAGSCGHLPLPPPVGVLPQSSAAHTPGRVGHGVWDMYMLRSIAIFRVCMPLPLAVWTEPLPNSRRPCRYIPLPLLSSPSTSSSLSSTLTVRSYEFWCHSIWQSAT